MLGFGEPLNVIDVRMRPDQHLALSQRKVHLPHELDDLLNRLVKPNVDEHPLAAVKDEIDIASEELPRLEVHLDHAWKNRLAGNHGS